MSVKPLQIFFYAYLSDIKLNSFSDSFTSVFAKQQMAPWCPFLDQIHWLHLAEVCFHCHNYSAVKLPARRVIFSLLYQVRVGFFSLIISILAF